MPEVAQPLEITWVETTPCGVLQGFWEAILDYIGFDGHLAYPRTVTVNVKGIEVVVERGFSVAKGGTLTVRRADGIRVDEANLALDLAQAIGYAFEEDLHDVSTPKSKLPTRRNQRRT